MGAEVKWLGDGTAVLVVGEGPTASTSLDGGRTLTDVEQVAVARLDVEFVHPEALYDEEPEIDPATGVMVEKQEPTLAPDAGGPASGVDPAGTAPATAPVHSRGESQNADELNAEIARLTALRDAQTTQGTESNPPTGATPPAQA